MPHERKRINIIPYPLEDRERIEARIKACRGNIHSPYCWYAEDVYRLLVLLDYMNTSVEILKEELEK